MGHSVSAGDAWVLYFAMVAAVICIPVAFAMGKEAGAKEMKRSLLRHPAIRATRRANQLDRVA